MANMSFFKNVKQEQDKNLDKWKILIADDEIDVHTVTKTVLSNFTYKDRELEFLSAYSGEETINILEENGDIVLVLLDVIMETDNAGLIVTKKIRDELNNKYIQIVLRTGQPADVPEAEVVREYEINDYKEKSELTANKLVTTLTTAIRSYENIKALESSKEEIIELNYELKDLLNSFDEHVIALKSDNDGKISYVSKALCEISGYEKDELINNNVDLLNYEDEKNEINEEIRASILNHEIWRGEIRNKRKDGSIYWLYMIISPKYNCKGEFQYYTTIAQDISARKDIENANKEIEQLNYEVEETQKEVIYKVGIIAETRSKETGEHLKRVAEYSKLMALKYGLDEEETEILKQASPMHDIGKLAIADEILNKNGKLTPEEFEVMKSHSKLGYDMLKGSDRSILKVASIVAHEHQEKWDGTGYPLGLKGEEIHIYGRITAIADVFDALGTKRCYKEPWSDEQIFEYLREQRGKHFDPQLIDIFFENLEEFLKIRDEIKDK